MKLWQKLVLIIVLTANLVGCVVIGAAAVGAVAATVIYDRRGIKSALDDHSITYNISQAIQNDPELKKETHIVVATYHRMVLLAGQAPTQALRRKVVKIAQSVSGIEQLYNEIALESPPSSLTETSDTWITSKVKSELLASSKLESGQFKVITDNGIVYIMGITTRAQADIAVNLARHVSGVEKVVKIFKYHTPSSEEILQQEAKRPKQQKVKKTTATQKLAANEEDLSHNDTAGTI